MDMSLEKCRYNTFTNDDDYRSTLAKNGFFKHNNDLIKCYNCSFEFKINHNNNNHNKEKDIILRLHDNDDEQCKTMKDRLLSYNGGGGGTTSKYFLFDSLKLEKERLKTFIDWPIPRILSPEKLAKDGFYYTREKDYCACFFCRVIIGKLERGDITPRGEHEKYSPHCPFVKGLPVGNVTLEASVILDKLVSDGAESPFYSTRERRMPYHDYESKGIFRIYDDEEPFNERCSYVLSREFSFKHHNWPKKRISQTPEELAEAGFYYCGLSDHVMCFHCGLGLRNWQFDCVPWEEHARHNPYCDYVYLTKGQDFIDKIRREKPLYDIRSKYPVEIPGRNLYFEEISTEDLNVLMNSLDIAKSLDDNRYSIPRLRKLLRYVLKRTGLPFKSRQQCLRLYNDMSIDEEPGINMFRENLPPTVVPKAG